MQSCISTWQEVVIPTGPILIHLHLGSQCCTGAYHLNVAVTPMAALLKLQVTLWLSEWPCDSIQGNDGKPHPLPQYTILPGLTANVSMVLMEVTTPWEEIWVQVCRLCGGQICYFKLILLSLPVQYKWNVKYECSNPYSHWWLKGSCPPVSSEVA